MTSWRNPTAGVRQGALHIVYGAERDDVEDLGDGHVLDPPGKDAPLRKFQFPQRLAQKGGLFHLRFGESDSQFGAGNHNWNGGKASSRTKIQQGLWTGRQRLSQPHAFGKVETSEGVRISHRSQAHFLIPAEYKPRICRQLFPRGRGERR